MTSVYDLPIFPVRLLPVIKKNNPKNKERQEENKKDKKNHITLVTFIKRKERTENLENNKEKASCALQTHIERKPFNALQ